MQKTDIQQLIYEGKIDEVVKYLYQDVKIVTKFVKQNSGDGSDANDVFQEAMVIFCQKVTNTGFELTSDIKTYFISICKNVWFNELRKRKKSFDASLLNETVYDEIEERKFQEAEVAFDKLSDSCKKLLNDFYVLKLSMGEIAEKWQVKSQKIVKDRKYKCLNKARKMYQTLHV